MGSDNSEAKAGVAALERGLSILEAFKSGGDALSLVDLANRTGLYKSTILRLSASLLNLGFLQRRDDGRYQLGPAVFELGRIYQRSFHLGDAVVPALRTLVAKSGESASFYIRDGGSDVCLYRVDSPHPVRDAGVAEGDRFPIDDSACSTMLSAFAGKAGAEFEAARRDIVLVARPSRRVAGVAAIVAPVFQVGNALAGVLLLSGPESRFSDATVDTMAALVIEQAAGLTRALGGNAALFDAAALRWSAARAS